MRSAAPDKRIRRVPHLRYPWSAARAGRLRSTGQSRFDFVLESYTLQVLPPELRFDATRCIASFVAPGGTLLVIARGREPDAPVGKMPWPLTEEELSLFEAFGLTQISFDDYVDGEEPPVRRFRATFVRNG